MIAVDTNVLVRLLVAEHPGQHAIAKSFFAGLSAAAPGFISLVVLAEAYWVLTAAYRLVPAAVRAALIGITQSEQVIIERPAIAQAALAQTSADIADWVIHLLGQDAGCTATVTFDKRFARQPGVTLLG